VFDPAMSILAERDWPMIRTYNVPLEDKKALFPDRTRVPCLDWPSQMDPASPHPRVLLDLDQQTDRKAREYTTNSCSFYDAVRASGGAA
jgi:hypothetical protein